MIHEWITALVPHQCGFANTALVMLQTENVHLAPLGVPVQDRWMQGLLRPQTNTGKHLPRTRKRENKWVCKILESVRRKWEAEGEECQTLCKCGGSQTAVREIFSWRMPQVLFFWGEWGWDMVFMDKKIPHRVKAADTWLQSKKKDWAGKGITGLLTFPTSFVILCWFLLT